MTTTHKIYLAGPMRGIKEFNFPQFFEATACLRAQGHTVYNPAEEDVEVQDFDWQGLTGNENLDELGFDLRFAFNGGLGWIVNHASCVVVLDGWQHSRGARAEVAVAQSLGLPVYAVDEVLNGHVGDRNCPEITVSDALDKVDDTNDTEMIVSPTGGIKGRKLAETGAIDPLAREELAKVAGFGSRKYDRGNYLKGYNYSLAIDALHRHLMAFEAGEDRDPESGQLHTAHVAWHGLALTSFVLRGVGVDDRYDTEAAA